MWFDSRVESDLLMIHTERRKIQTTKEGEAPYTMKQNECGRCYNVIR